MDYEKASKLRKTGLLSNINQSLAEGRGFSSFGQGISDTMQAKMTGIKEFFDPMRIAKGLFGGGKWGNMAAGITGSMFGRKQQDIDYFMTGGKNKRKGIGNIDLAFYTKMGEGRISKLKSGERIADVGLKLVNLLKEAGENRKLRYELLGISSKELNSEEVQGNKELLEVVGEGRPNTNKKTKTGEDGVGAGVALLIGAGAALLTSLSAFAKPEERDRLVGDLKKKIEDSSLTESLGSPEKTYVGRGPIPMPTPENPTPAPPPYTAVPEAPIVAARPTTATEAINMAAKKTGQDPATLFSVAKIESDLRPDAVPKPLPGKKKPPTTAKGLNQITDPTWKGIIERHPQDDYSRGPFDPETNALAGARLTEENIEYMKRNKIPITPESIYAMHFMGIPQGPKLLKASPDEIGARLFPVEAEKNPNNFYRDGNKKTPRTVAEILDLFKYKMSVAKRQTQHLHLSDVQDYKNLGNQLAAASLINKELGTKSGAQLAIVTNKSITLVEGPQEYISVTNRPGDISVLMRAQYE